MVWSLSCGASLTEPGEEAAYRIESVGWGGYLLRRGQDTLTDFPEGLLKMYPEEPERLVQPLVVLGRDDVTGYTYARDFDTWLRVVDEGIKAGSIGTEMGV